MSRTIIILIHGFNKNHLDMNYLSNHFRNRNTDTISVNLSLKYKNLKYIINQLHNQINKLNLKNYNNINIVAHSMGGIVAVKYLNLHKIENLSNLICIGTPFKGTKLANIASLIPFYTFIHKPLKDIKAKNKTIILKNKDINIHLIAGNRTKKILGKIFLKKGNDGLIDLDSALGHPTTNKYILNYNHWMLHKNKECINIINYIIN